MQYSSSIKLRFSSSKQFDATSEIFIPRSKKILRHLSASSIGTVLLDIFRFPPFQHMFGKHPNTLAILLPLMNVLEKSSTRSLYIP
jgi:hypothetical protein